MSQTTARAASIHRSVQAAAGTAMISQTEINGCALKTLYSDKNETVLYIFAQKPKITEY